MDTTWRAASGACCADPRKDDYLAIPLARANSVRPNGLIYRGLSNVCGAAFGRCRVHDEHGAHLGGHFFVVIGKSHPFVVTRCAWQRCVRYNRAVPNWSGASCAVAVMRFGGAFFPTLFWRFFFCFLLFCRLFGFFFVDSFVCIVNPLLFARTAIFNT